MPRPPQSGAPASRRCAAAGPGWLAGGAGPAGLLPGRSGRAAGGAMVSGAGRPGRSGPGGRGLREGKGWPPMGGGLARGCSAAGRGGGCGEGSPRRGRGCSGGGAASGGGSVPGARARGRGFFVRYAAARSGQRRRLGAAAALPGAGVSPPPLHARHRGPQFRAPGWPLDSSGRLGIFKINGGGGRLGIPQGGPEDSGGVKRRSAAPGDVWRPFRRWGN